MMQSTVPRVRNEPGVLGALCYTVEAADGEGRLAGAPCLRVPMPRLDSRDAPCEIWRAGAGCVEGGHGPLRYRYDKDALFGVIALQESAFAEESGKTPLQRATEAAYRTLFTAQRELRFPHLYRCWNYLADINGESHGLERYRQFNLGRQDAHAAAQREVAGDFPAACALGSAAGPLNIAFLAGRTAPLRIENPRQVSAYHYPGMYGPRTPLFSRATLLRLPDRLLLLISGTASVVGHVSRHAGDVVAQAQETLNNLEAVIAEANRLAGGREPRFGLRDLVMRVYVRHAADLARVQAVLAQRMAGGTPNAVYLRADVCRPDLLLEIEAHATVAPGSAAGGDLEQGG